MLVEVARDIPEQRDVGVVVGHRPQRQRIRQPGHPDVEPRIGVDGEEMAAELRVANPLGEQRLEDVPVHEILVGEPLPGDLEQAVPEAANRRGAPLDVRLGRGPESRRRSAVERGRETGLLEPPELHEVVEEGVELAISGLRGHRHRKNPVTPSQRPIPSAPARIGMDITTPMLANLLPAATRFPVRSAGRSSDGSATPSHFQNPNNSNSRPHPGAARP